MDNIIEIEYLPVTHGELPVQKIFEIGGNDYIINFDYNDMHDFYTMTIVDEDENPVYAAKLSYLTNAIQNAVPGLELKERIVPLIMSDVSREVPQVERIGKDVFDNTRISIL
jgi:hypothetical protein